ncbi:uncharacterized protein N7500_005583 [Penicillium coprophilum]|uniref:uncharacterized protein n=1 Tax=Penicillium coprophilum TaxID=36646 RepID=UPI00238EA058|nr:uncharacterized protein N7500_005583 [Penicillium coprophilum]KAJ5163753.1 hypothetical protein N7500_005583 [Penicillium coprophilum]
MYNIINGGPVDYYIRPRLCCSSSLSLTLSFFLPLYLSLIAAPYILLWPSPTTAHLLSARRTVSFIRYTNDQLRHTEDNYLFKYTM